jgi:hypothetical protein
VQPPERDRRPGVGTKGGGDLVGDAVTGEHTADLFDITIAVACIGRGCTCNYEVILTGVYVGGVRHVHVAHDDGCPALDGAA